MAASLHSDDQTAQGSVPYAVVGRTFDPIEEVGEIVELVGPLEKFIEEKLKPIR